LSALISYAGASHQKGQNIGKNAKVVLQTVRVHSDSGNRKLCEPYDKTPSSAGSNTAVYRTEAIRILL
jgi:hypothetical protein